jgi:hypothetical protein
MYRRDIRESRINYNWYCRECGSSFDCPDTKDNIIGDHNGNRSLLIGTYHINRKRCPYCGSTDITNTNDYDDNFYESQKPQKPQRSALSILKEYKDALRNHK